MKPTVPTLALVLAACSATTPAISQNAPFASVPVATFDKPWAMTFLPDGRMLVTEKGGKLKLASADGKTIVDVAGVPTVDSAGQGGLMDVVLHPKFAENRLVYLSFSEKGAGGKGVVAGSGHKVSSQSELSRAEKARSTFGEP